MDKYNNGRPIGVPENEGEKALAISEWAEGNEHLQNALASCIDNGIQTYASCKGHGLTTSPYISLKVTSENIGQITNIINSLSRKKGVNVSLSFDEIAQGSILTIYPNILNRNEIFDIVATSFEQKLDFGKADDMTQELVRLHETLRVYGYKNDRMRSVIELHNGVMGRNLLLKHDIGSYDYILDDELTKAPFSKKKDNQGFRMFSLKGSKFGKNLSTLKLFNGSLISALTHQDCELVENDEFIKGIYEDPIRKQIRERVVGKKGDKILENTFDDIGLARILNEKTVALINRLKISGINTDEVMKQYPVDGVLTTKIDKEQAIELVRRFFESIGIDKTELLDKGKKVNENGQTVYLSYNKDVKRNEASNPTFSTDDAHAYVKETGTLTDVYALVHEISHTFYVQNGFNESRMILGEVVPQCMERLLDGFLMNLTDEQKQNLGFDEQILKEDIRKRKISTSIDRLDISSRIANNKYQNAGKKAEFTRYMLAQIYSTQFMKLGENERKGRLLEFISALRNNNIQQANAAFDIKINRENGSNRSEYISDTIWELQQDLTAVPNGNNIIENKSTEKQVVVDRETEAR